jgi:hypothetical protein
VSEPVADGLDPSSHADHSVELRKEAFTMALYVAICLLAALAAVSESTAENHVFEIVWGTTVGLALAHWFAFRVSARLVAAGAIRRHDALAALAQLLGAVAVALLATVPALILPASVELEVVAVVLACFIAVVGYLVSRSSGASRMRSVIYGGLLLLVAGIVVVVKITLTGH